jgi:hypothetical protein
MDEAKAIVSDVQKGKTVTYGAGYYDRVLCYAGLVPAEEIEAKALAQADPHMYATISYGLSWFYTLRGQKERAYAILEKINNNTEKAWSGFAEHAARRDYANWGNQ